MKDSNSSNSIIKEEETRTTTTTTSSSSSSINSSSMLVADEVIAEFFSFLVAEEIIKCSRVCKNWYKICRHSRSLWHRLVREDFGLALSTKSKRGDDGDDLLLQADWYTIYCYIIHQKEERLEHEKQRRRQRQQRRREHEERRRRRWPQQQQPPYFNDWFDMEEDDDLFIQQRLIFCDDGSHQPGNNPEHALQRWTPDECWCTNAFVDQDVDLVATLDVPHLIMSIEITNGPPQYSAPLKEALVFASMDMPDLEKARKYDGKNGGIELAREIFFESSSNNNNNNDNSNSYRAALPPRTDIQQLQQMEKQQKQQRKTQFDDDDDGYPIGGFCFPPIPQAYGKKIEQDLSPKPKIAKYVHYKLLTSSKCIDRVSNNIDVCELFVFGIPLPELERMIHVVVSDDDKNNNNNPKPPPPPDPSAHYSKQKRRHRIREYPWHIHDAFHQNQQQQLQQQQQQQQQQQLQQRDLLPQQQIILPVIDLHVNPNDDNDDDDDDDVES